MPNIPQIQIGGVSYNVKDADFRNNAILASSSQPSQEENRLWINESASEEYEVPTYEEFVNVKNAIQDSINGQIPFVANLVPDSYIDPADGSVKDESGWSATDFIPLLPGETIEFDNAGETTRWCAFYDANKAFVAGTRFDAGLNIWTVYTSGIYLNIRYVRISNETAAMKNSTMIIHHLYDKTLTKQGEPPESAAVGDRFTLTDKKIECLPASIINNIPEYCCSYADYPYTAGTQGWYEKLLASLPVQGGNNYAIVIDNYLNFPHSEDYVIYIYGSDANDNVLQRLHISDATGRSAVFEAAQNVVKWDIYMELDRNEGISESGTAKLYGLRIYNLNNDTKIQLHDLYTINGNNVITDALPAYYETYLASKIADIRGYDDAVGNGGDRFIFITDYHDYYTGNSNYSPALIEQIIKKVPVSMTIFGGDGVNAADTEPEMKDRLMAFLGRFKNIPSFYPIIGNHEFYSDWLNPGDYKGGITKYEVYAYLNKQFENTISTDGISGMRIDNKNSKIRYYMLGCDYYVSVDEATKKWFFEDIATTPNDYIVIVSAHYALKVDVTPHVVASGFADIHNAIKAIINHNNYTYDGTTYNYSGMNIKIPLVLAGHTHADGDAVIDGVQYVTVTSDNGRLAELEIGINNRPAGTVSEQAFDVVSIDKVAKKIYMTRIGGGNNREFSYL